MNGSIVPQFRLKGRLNREDYALIDELREVCMRHDGIMLKLELDYKLEDAKHADVEHSREEINEFLSFNGNELIGYAGICSFGGPGSPLEITGMVHPTFRRQGLFSELHELVMAECGKRQAGKILLLCDRKSVPGVKFLDKIQAERISSEFEMHLLGAHEATGKKLPDIFLRKASNSDAAEVARQNRIYFDASAVLDPDDTSERLILPEEEEKRGVTIYLAEHDEEIIGKVHLQLINGIGGIYGLGVLPPFRGKGFGRMILLQAIRILREAGASDIMLQVEARNDRALTLYRSCGFKETSVMDYYEMKQLEQ